jgi:hypothetical protein
MRKPKVDGRYNAADKCRQYEKKQRRARPAGQGFLVSVCSIIFHFFLFSFVYPIVTIPAIYFKVFRLFMPQMIYLVMYVKRHASFPAVLAPIPCPLQGGFTDFLPVGCAKIIHAVVHP